MQETEMRRHPEIGRAAVHESNKALVQNLIHA
jgi:hypothetical protein